MLMVLLAHAGRRSEALQVYQDLGTALYDERTVPLACKLVGTI